MCVGKIPIFAKRAVASGLAPLLVLSVSCQFKTTDALFAPREGRPVFDRTGPAPESLDLIAACNALGVEMAMPDMVVDAGRSEIQLPTRAHRVEISAAPATLDQEDTEYVLMQDVSAPLTAFEITASNITLNLNGHRVIYGTEPSPDVSFPYGTAGVKTSWGLTGVVLANGEIMQGGGPCSGDPSGRNCNPVIFQGGTGTNEIGGLRLSYHTPDTSGIVDMSDGQIHHNTLIDSGSLISYPGTGVPAIRSEATSVHHNAILGARHRGIVACSHSEIYDNEIHLNSYTSNSYGIMIWEVQDVQVHHNKIYGLGVHPIGIGPMGTGTTDVRVYSNFVETENTRTDPTAANYSSALRIMTYDGWCDRIEVVGNYFVSNGGTAHPDLVGKSWGRCLWIGSLAPGNTADIHHNYIQALTADETVYHPALAVVSGGFNDGLTVRDNVVVANHTMVALADGYNAAGAGYPRFIRNRFIRKDQYPTYRTIADKQYNLWDITGLFLDNSYEDGAELNADTIELLYFCAPHKTEIGVGRLVGGQPSIDYYVTNDSTRVVNATSVEPFSNCGFKIVP